MSEPQKKGFIRWEAILPATLIIGLIAAYFVLFFDSHLRRGIELVGYSVLGSEVNVASVTTSFTKASIQISGLQVTDAENPTHNLISVEDIKFAMSWDALLRGKILIEIASVEQIQFNSQRQAPGRVKPPEPESNEPSFVEREGQKLKNEALNTAKEKYNQNVLGDVASILSGGSAQEQSANLQDQLKSKAMLQGFQKDFANKQLQWNQKLKELPQQKEISAWGERFKKIKTKDFKTPQELQETLKQLQSLVEELDTRYKGVEKSSEEVNGDIKSVESHFREIDQQVQADIKELEAHFKIPKLDSQAITQALFNRYVGPYLAQFHKYQGLANKYLPPRLLDKKNPEKEDSQVQPHPRDRGVSYEFGRVNAYPLFWLKKAIISSKATPGVPALGNLSGEATNIASNQALTGLPAELKFTGDFPELKILGVDAQITLNHVKKPFRETLVARVNSYPVDKKMLLNGHDLELGFTKANGTSTINASFSDSVLDLSLSNAYKDLDSIVSSSNKELDGILKTIISGIPTWTIEAQGKGALPNLNMNLNSNLGPEIAHGFEKILQQKIDEAKAKVKKIVDEAIGKEKAKLEAELAKAKKQFEAEIAKVKEAVSKQKSDVEKKVDETKKEESKKVQNQVEQEVKKRLGPDAQKKLDELKKKIKF